MSDIEDKLSSSSSDNEEIPSISTEIIDNDEPITTNIQSGKPKKPRSEKQLAALEKARATRKAKIQANKKLKEDHSNLIEENKEMLKKLANTPQKEHYNPYPKKKPRKKIVYADDSEPSDEEVIIVKKKPPKRKKPIKKQIIYESSSSSSSEEEDNTISNDIQKQSIQYEEEPQYHYYSNKPLKYSDIINFG